MTYLLLFVNSSMAKISLNTLRKITQAFQTGISNQSDADFVKNAPDKPNPGVQDIQPFSVVQGQSGEKIDVMATSRKAVVIISPFMVEDPTKRELFYRYAKRCAQDSMRRNEAPLVSHVFYYDMFGFSTVAIERDLGFNSQLTWIRKTDLVVVYSDFGITQGMKAAIDYAKFKNKKIEFRKISSTA